MKSGKFLPLAAMEKLMKQAAISENKEVRVSERAKVALQEVLENYANNISQKAIDLARHTGRRTVKKEDIELASKQ